MVPSTDDKRPLNCPPAAAALVDAARAPDRFATRLRRRNVCLSPSSGTTVQK